MKKLKLRNSIATTLLVFLFLTGCYQFDFVNQPYTADPDSSFDVQISVTVTGSNPSSSYFGILLPIGWTTADSIEYILENTNYTSFMVCSGSLSQQMSTIDPPPENYYWWVGEDIISTGSNPTFISEFKIYTDNQTGTFFLDYMLGDNYNGLNYRRSNDHLIIVGDVVGCLPEGITFTSQAEIDNFQANYPDCNEIAGNITISGNEITNLNGLYNVTSIGGSLWIKDNGSLTSLGLANLSSIGGTFSLNNNNQLTSLTGLDNVNSIGGDLSIYSNNALTNLMGLEGLTLIGGNFGISSNYVLTSLTGLDNLTSIGGGLNIYSNDGLTSVTGLGNLTSIAGNFSIGNYYFGPIGPSEVQCFGNLSLISLSGLENLTSIGGSLNIVCNDSLTSLTGLDNLTSVGEDLRIIYTTSLTSLTGLDNVTSIGGSLLIQHNYALINLSGLDNVTSIGGNLGIGYNDALTSITGLDNVTNIVGDLSIFSNNALISLSGLDNIDAGSITDLYITNNISLSTCEVQSICDYLLSPNGTINIHNNSLGCNSQDEVEEACEDVSVDEVHLADKLMIFPNPSSTQITVELPNAPQKSALLTIYNMNSQQVIIHHITEQKTVVDVSGLPNGFYFVKVADDKAMMVGKMVKK